MFNFNQLNLRYFGERQKNVFLETLSRFTKNSYFVYFLYTKTIHKSSLRRFDKSELFQQETEHI